MFEIFGFHNPSSMRSPGRWSPARSPRGPLRVHPLCGPLRARPVVLCAYPGVLYALAPSVVPSTLTPWPSARSPPLWSPALTPWPYALTPSVVPSALSQWPSARSARGPLRAHPVCRPLRAHPMVHYALSPSALSCALTRGPLRAHPVCGPLHARPVVYALTPSLVPCAFTQLSRLPRLWYPTHLTRGLLRAHPGCGPIRAQPVVL